MEELLSNPEVLAYLAGEVTMLISVVFAAVWVLLIVCVAKLVR